jgi:hypothetical protein
MIDVSGLPSGAALSAADFAFQSGSGNGVWSAAPAPSSVTVRRGAGVGGSDRVTITFPDGAIKNQWLQVAMNATANTGLVQRDVFYFGNIVGDTGDSATSAVVNALDMAAVKRALNTASTLVGKLDFNRDGRVNSLDLATVRANLNRRLELGAAPAGGVAAASVFSNTVVAPASAASAPAPATTTDANRVWTEQPADLLGRA